MRLPTPLTRKLLEALTTVQPKLGKELTEVEKVIRKAKQLCFNFDEKWRSGHKCSGKLYLLSTDGGCFSKYMENTYEDDEIFMDALEEIQLIEHTLINLYALDGLLSPKTIWLVGNVLGRDMTILVDLGSTHNFVQVGMVLEGKLKVSPI